MVSFNFQSIDIWTSYETKPVQKLVLGIVLVCLGEFELLNCNRSRINQLLGGYATIV